MANPIRLYLDEDAQQLTLVRALRARQIDVLTVNEAGLTSLPDGEQLAYASASGRVIFTFNRGDFVRLHKLYLQLGQSHTGIIVSDQLQMGVIIPGQPHTRRIRPLPTVETVGWYTKHVETCCRAA